MMQKKDSSLSILTKPLSHHAIVMTQGFFIYFKNAPIPALEA